MPSSTSRPLAHRLDDEWERISRQRSSVRRANGWRVLEGRIDHLDELLRAAGYGLGEPRDPRRVHPDVVLGRLVVTARDDELAARVVLQRVLPGLRHRARQWCAGTRRARDDILGELVGVAWSMIRTYDVTRRGGYVAANLVRDSAHYAFVAPSRRRWSSERATDPSAVDVRRSTDENPSGELLVLLADAARNGVAREHVDLLGELVSADGMTDVVAEHHGVTTRMIRYRRVRALAELRAFVADTADDDATAAA